MGLDMYLEGEKYHRNNWEDPSKNRIENSKRVKSVTVELGYWRKHPDLHGFIVNTFNNGEDDCEPIELSEEDMRTIIEAVKGKNLPHTEGFFFGKSDGSEDEETIKIFEDAIAWMNEKENGVFRSVKYEASW